VGASNNVINKVGDRETSLFQICVNLRNRLRGVPGFEEQLLEVEDEELDEEDTDPVTLLWRTFRRGYPLLTIYNALEPDEPLELDGSKFPVASSQRAVERRQKAAAFMFLKACLDRLKVPSDECFMISDLYGDDTSGFVRVSFVFKFNGISEYGPQKFEQRRVSDREAGNIMLINFIGCKSGKSSCRHPGPGRLLGIIRRSFPGTRRGSPYQTHTKATYRR